MLRGEMIRRLDDAAVEVKARLGNGPLTPVERASLLQTLETLLPMVADELQDLEDLMATAKLLGERRRTRA